MAVEDVIAVPQSHETPVTLLERPGYYCRYAYARSADSLAADDSGQDCLVLRASANHLAFALCDGVSQSFVGDLAARLLATALAEWFDTLADSDRERLAEALQQRLTELVMEAGAMVDDFALPADLPPLVRDVLEQKRALGSESTFVAGAFDFEQGQLVLVWMGDSRLRVWGDQGERTSELGATFHTAERWSSRRGPIGTPHTAILPLEDIRRLLVYSDGFAVLDTRQERLSNEEIDTLIASAGNQPTSDDVSLLEVWLEPGAQPARQPVNMPPAEMALLQAELLMPLDKRPEHMEPPRTAEIASSRTAAVTSPDQHPDQAEPQATAGLTWVDWLLFVLAIFILIAALAFWLR